MGALFALVSYIKECPLSTSSQYCWPPSIIDHQTALQGLCFFCAWWRVGCNDISKPCVQVLWHEMADLVITCSELD